MHTPVILRHWLARLVIALIVLPAGLHAQAEPPGRVGRLVPLQGAVSVFDADSAACVAASPNLPVTSGSHLSTATGARAEIRIGSTVLRLGGASDLEVLQLDDTRLAFELHAGSVALRVRSNELAAEISVVTQEAALRPLQSGSYRIDRHDLTTLAASQRGELLVDTAGGWLVGSGQRVEIWRDGASRELRQAWAARANDEFARWVDGADRDDGQVARAAYVSPEMTGAEDLDRHGRWDRHPDLGAVWLPYTVAVGWAPYQYGRWAWVRPWGWTWVDAAPWGFAPFHYGRWVSWGGRWCWAPGLIVARPVYAPALVSWVGGPPPAWRGGPIHPPAAWVPLAPHQAFVPLRPVLPPAVEQRKPPPPHGAPRVFLPAPAMVAAPPSGAVPTPRAPAPAMPVPPVSEASPVHAAAPRPTLPPPRPVPAAPPAAGNRPFNAMAGAAVAAPDDVRTRMPVQGGRSSMLRADR